MTSWQTSKSMFGQMDHPNLIGRAPSQIRNYVHKIVRANYTRQDGHATPQPLAPLAANRLGEIHVPTLILVGEYDTCDTLAVADKLATRHFPCP